MRTGENDHRNKLDDPPNSRLFIICSKNLTEDDFRNSFNRFGNMDEVWIVKDRVSGESKGVCYIKYSKTSEAAIAMETMNGVPIKDDTRPLKVMIASSKDQGSKREDNEERLLRLFIVVPKNMTEDDVRHHFQKFGDIEYVNIIKDRETKESKGIAYVKYSRMSHAATAFEECDRTFKAVFARPKESNQERFSHGSNLGGGLISERGGPPVREGFDRGFYNGGPGDVINNFPNPDGYTRLIVSVLPAVPQDTVAQLFDLIPGLEFCRYSNDGKRSYNTRRFSIQYNAPQAAAYAAEKLHGFEYPPGHRIMIKPDLDYISPPMYPGYGGPGHDFAPRGGYKKDLMIPDIPHKGAVPKGMVALTKALAEAATQVIQKVGFIKGSDDSTFCSVSLPSPKPLASKDAVSAERLFIVCQPSPPPNDALWDVFGRFGNLIDVYLLNGKNCGYVNYSDKESASKAIEVLHGAEICRARLKVMLAEPKQEGGTGTRKRMRPDMDY